MSQGNAAVEVMAGGPELAEIRERYGRSRLTPDVMPYDGVGIAAPGEYKAVLAFTRAASKNDLRTLVRYTQEADTLSNEYRGAMAALRGGLVKGEMGGGYKITPYGRLYLEQRSGS